MILPQAIDKVDVANYVTALFGVYFILIIARVLMSWVPRIPRSSTLRPLLDFITETTDPYLNVFRRMLRGLGAGGMIFDVSPILAIIVLLVAERIIVGALINP